MTSERSDRQFLIGFPGGATSPESSFDTGSGHAHSYSALDKRSSRKPSPQRHMLPASIRGESPQRVSFNRRRVHSANSVEVEARLGESSSSPRAQFLTEPAKPRRVSYRRNQHLSTAYTSPGSLSHNGSSPLAKNSVLPSDDVDEDPNILADLQRALQYKSRVEEQLRGVNHPEVNSAQFPSSPTPSSSHHPLSGKIPFVHSDSGMTERSSPSNLDFSPSTGKAAMHPIPKSTDDGATLDWSGFESGDEKRERRWSMGIHRKPPKEKSSPMSRKGFVDKQEVDYEAKLERIKARASEQTRRKAHITREQMQHRYGTLDSFPSFNLAEAARWFNNLDEGRKRSMGAPEQFPWITHLLKKRKERHSRSPWTLSAQIVDEFVKSTPGMGEYLNPSALNFTQGVTNVQDMHSHTHDLEDVLSRPTSLMSSENGDISRKKSEDVLSFEPITAIQSRRGSAATGSQNSTDARVRQWQTGIDPFQDSPESTLVKDSPASSVQIRGDTTSQYKFSAQPGPRRYFNPKDQGQSFSPPRTPENDSRARSPLSSMGGVSERVRKRTRPTPASTQSDSSVIEVDSSSDAAGKSRRASLFLGRIGEDTVPDLSKEAESRSQRRGKFRLSLDMKASQSKVSVEEARTKLLPPISISDLRTDVQLGPDGKPILKSLTLPQTAKPFHFPHGGLTTTGTTSNPSRISLTRHLASEEMEKRKRAKIRRKARMSLPGSLHSSNIPSERGAQRTESNAATLSLDYARKREHLDALKARNIRMKQVLQTVGKTISEYNEVQRALAERLGMSYQEIPSDVLEAICHDPASATGNTRQATGWKAVEEIYERCQKQKAALNAFEALLTRLAPATMQDGGVFQKDISILSSQLIELSKERDAITSQSKQLVELLRHVKELRDQLKPELDETGKHTSVNYPELVRLESLLDELVSRRNVLWRVMEIFVSFSLTLFAPVIKMFGRPVWDDLHDFLVIPLYRNDFSGGDQWYPVSFPKRSFTHWLRLLTVFLVLPVALKSGSEAFLELLTGGYLVRVPSYIPAPVVYVILSFLISSFAGALLFLLFAFLCEIAIILWWTGWLLWVVK